MSIELAYEDEHQQTKKSPMDFGAGCGEASERREGLPAFFTWRTQTTLTSFSVHAIAEAAERSLERGRLRI
jgi:hypothetical protein